MMVGYTKADFDNMYSIGAEAHLPPDHENGPRTPVRLNYHYGVIAPYLARRWDHLIPYLNLTASDIVLIVGSGFGWSCEYLVEQLPGITCVGVDISDYIQAAKDLDEDAELDAAIIAGGLDPAVGRGLLLKQTYSRPGPRAKQVVIQEDAKTQKSRNEIRKALGNVWPTWIFTEDMLNEEPADLSDQEILDLVSDYSAIPVPITHIIGGETRTAEELNALTGQRVLFVDGTGGVRKDIS
jgi:hypothetical protein